jgi:hypothetical protein
MQIFLAFGPSNQFIMTAHALRDGAAFSSVHEQGDGKV